METNKDLDNTNAILEKYAERISQELGLSVVQIICYDEDEQEASICLQAGRGLLLARKSMVEMWLDDCEALDYPDAEEAEDV